MRPQTLRFSRKASVCRKRAWTLRWARGREGCSDSPLPTSGLHPPRNATTTTAASGGNREELLGQRPARRECRPRHEADAGCRNPLERGCSPLTILKKKSKHKKASAAPVGAIALTLFRFSIYSPSVAARQLPHGGAARPQRRAFAESGAANAVFRYDPSRENAFGALRRARQTRNLK